MGRSVLHFNSRIIIQSSVVHIFASEATDWAEGNGEGSGAPFASVLGDASISVQNVSVRQGAVDFVVLVDWPRPLNVVADITVLNTLDALPSIDTALELVRGV